MLYIIKLKAIYKRGFLLCSYIFASNKKLCHIAHPNLPDVNLYQVVCFFNVSKSRLFEWLFKKNGCLAVSGSDLGSELTTSSLRQDSSWGCFSTSVSLPCINPQAQLEALICTISWNQQKSRWTCVWIEQDFSSSVTGSDLLFAVSANWMGKEGKTNPDV